MCNLWKRTTSLLLTLCLLSVLLPGALAQTEVRPLPPPWCPEEDYDVFEPSAAYEPENWAKLQALRDLLSKGKHLYTTLPAQQFRDYNDLKALAVKQPELTAQDLGLCFELALLDTQLLLPESGTGALRPLISDASEAVFRTLPAGSPERYLFELWSARTTLSDPDRLFTMLERLCLYPQFSIDRLLSDPAISPETAAAVRSTIYVTLDGALIHPKTVRGMVDGQPVTQYTEAQVRNNRTMVPVRRLAEVIGSDVIWDPEGNTITIVRGGNTIVMSLGSTAATLNGAPVQMDAAPYAEDGTTYIPVRYMAEFFGQRVEWVPQRQLVAITEDKSKVGDSNLEAWALPMAAIYHIPANSYGVLDLSYKALRRATFYGSTTSRNLDLPVGSDSRGKLPRDHARISLSGSWGIQDRAGLISTVASMTYHGHNDSFLEAAAIADSLTDAQMADLVARSSGADVFMWPYTRALSERWGDRGILAWDLFRMAMLAERGYSAGYLTYPEALAVMEPAARLLQENFSSWDEAYENYLDGYHWWAREEVEGQDVWATERGKLYQAMKADPEVAPIFDDALFSEGVIPVPGVTLQDLIGK